MIVSHAGQFIYLRLPKTASTSLAIALCKYCGPDDIITTLSPADQAIRAQLGYRGPQHYPQPWYRYPPKDILSIVVTRRFPRYLHPTASQVKWLVGREVWDRYFKFCVERNPFDRAISKYHYDQRTGRPLPDVNDYICRVPPRLLSSWAQYTIGGRVAVDYVGRYEDLEAELPALARRLGVPDIVLLRTKAHYRTDRRHYSQVLNAAARRHIERACAREIAMFSYHWTDAASSGSDVGAAVSQA